MSSSIDGDKVTRVLPMRRVEAFGKRGPHDHHHAVVRRFDLVLAWSPRGYTGRAHLTGDDVVTSGREVLSENNRSARGELI